MPATYNEPWTGPRDELRALFQDNKTAAGTNTLPRSPVTDYVFDKALEDKGLVEGAVWLAETYASHYALLIRKYANTRGGSSIEYIERQKFFAEMATKLKSGAIVLGQGGLIGGTIAGSSLVGAAEAKAFRRTGVWPDPMCRA